MVPSPTEASVPPQPRAERALDVLNLLLSDVRYGLGAYLGVYLLAQPGWDEASIGLALSIGGLCGLVAGPFIGAFVDAARPKRALLSLGVLVATGTCLAIPLAPTFLPVAAAGVVGALGGSLIGPALAGISLGMVGPARFARRAARNEALFHAGNAAINGVILLAAPSTGPVILFALIGATGLASAAAVFAVPARAIDHARARGLAAGARPAAWRALLASRPLLVFAVTGALFHLGNAAMLGLVGQRLARLAPDSGLALTAACAVTAQAVMVPTALLAGALADRVGRKPLWLAAYGALALRGGLLALAESPAAIVATQLLDGLGAGLVGAVYSVIIADLSRGTGRFNAAAGAVGTVHGVGGVLSAALAGAVVVGAGYPAAFLALAGAGLLGGALFAALMPETRP